ncbi:MAG: c-type cytochrome biogenesis protein CcmI [Alphaproteobacteria bacterium]|nr:MAG: c-type cytochrome biogenesis protein CcmI [Alphaproteobacteria bacterium]
MILWLAISGLAALVIGTLLWAVVRSSAPASEISPTDTRFLEDQLDAAEDAESRAEIGRRLLAAARITAPVTYTTMGGGARRALIVAIVLLVPLTAALLYGLLGKPGQPSQYRGLQSIEEITADASIEELVPYMASIMRQRADDAQGWALLAQQASRIGRHDLAVIAFINLNRLDPLSAQIVASLAEAKIAEAQGLVTPDARKLLVQSLEMVPDLSSPQYYLGLYDLQQGNPDSAAKRWQSLLDNSPTDAPWVPRVRQALDQLAAGG